VKDIENNPILQKGLAIAKSKLLAGEP